MAATARSDSPAARSSRARAMVACSALAATRCTPSRLRAMSARNRSHALTARPLCGLLFPRVGLLYAAQPRVDWGDSSASFVLPRRPRLSQVPWPPPRRRRRHRARADPAHPLASGGCRPRRRPSPARATRPTRSATMNRSSPSTSRREARERGESGMTSAGRRARPSRCALDGVKLVGVLKRSAGSDRSSQTAVT